ncbi:hypothetical protein F0L17_14165 [Streptomyces sp. TRM43335]|uniref:Uncharacterized protein n=1 Tax=Streptomyces taklimakanensis TaxID=2569853 RepID=A0A6G2BEA1_9ACTN|nr:hypothetical protein [Streptomyces taklimakanensis]MTE20232.1 hypothetical protein [Streptomyces taklimakanensis]
MTTTVPPTATPHPATPQRSDTEQQIDAADALKKLLADTVGLPRITWIIDSTGWRLYGYIHDRDAAAFNAYADRLGGTIRIGRAFTEGDHLVRDQRLDTTYHNVPVEIATLATVTDEEATKEAAA